MARGSTIVRHKVERVVARITTACSTCHATNFSVASCSNMLRKVDPSSTFCIKCFQLATLKFVACKVDHAVVVRATTSLICNATMLRDKLNENVALDKPCFLVHFSNTTRAKLLIKEQTSGGKNFNRRLAGCNLRYIKGHKTLS